MSCKYAPHAHYTAGAMTYHSDKCVSEWMAKMSNVENCVEYMAGIGRTNPEMQTCTVGELEHICTEKQQHFSVDDAKALCGELNKGHARFWKQYYAEKKG